MDIKQEYWDIAKEIDIESYLNPTNLESEKIIFKEHFYNSKSYNPQYHYKEINFNTVNIIKRLEELRLLFNNKIDFHEYYTKKIDLDISYIRNLEVRSEENFSKWLTSLYGTPTASLNKKAISIINKLKSESKEIESSLSPEETAGFFLERLNFNNFNGWTIEIKEIPAKISINPVKKIITIKSNAKFSSYEIKRLIAHEIDVHVLRNENGSIQHDKLFQYGFPGYLKTEEGLAITSEYRQNLLSDFDLKIYCSRVIASYNSINKDFFNLFKIIYKYHDFDQTYSIVSRIKRGLLDSSIHGGYTKDQIYLKGYLELKELKDYELDKLFCGKIGLTELNKIDSLGEIKQNYKRPNWLKNT